jgi:lipopolysaccharide export system permease protein
MMRGLTRYVFKQLGIGMILITAGLSILLWLSQSLRFIDMIVNKGLSVAVFLKLTMLLLPGFLMVILPIAMFAVTLFIYNKLTTDRELVVMRAAGMSQWQLATPAMILATIVCVLSYTLTLWGGPYSVKSFRELQWEIRNDVSHLVLKEGEFTELGRNTVVFVAEREGDNVLKGILLSDNSNPDKQVTVMAERGALVVGTAVPRLHLVNGNRQEYIPKDQSFSILYFDSYTTEFGESKQATEIRFRDARERSLQELFTIEETPQLDANNIRRFRVEGVQRLLLPLQVIGMTLLALYGLLGGSFNRRGQAQRVIFSIVLMVAFQAIALGANNLASRSLSFLPILPLLTTLLIAIPAYLLFVDRSPKARKPKNSGEPL